MIKGALVSVSSTIPIPSLIRFQYNPEKLTRSVKPSFYSGGSDGTQEPARFGGAPSETISLDAQFDATDGMESGSIMTKTMGIRPQLAALELLTYPGLIPVAQNATLLSSGMIEAVPVPAARTLLIFGLTRIVPVRITSVDVTEDMFDSNLNPIRATASLSMDVISHSQVYPDEPLFAAHIAYQGVLEAQALAFKAQEAMWLLKKGAAMASSAASKLG